jgi:hypothetical protein
MAKHKNLPNGFGVGEIAHRNADAKPNMAPLRAYPQSISLQPYPQLRDRYLIKVDDLPAFPILASKLLTWKRFRKAVLRQIAVRFPEDEPPNWHELVSAAGCAALERGGAK